MAQRHPHAIALASLASAHVSSAKEMHTEAIGHLESALREFMRLDLPLETAQVRLDLAHALAERRPQLAAAEASRAMAAFEQLGAAVDADASASLLRSLGAPARTDHKHVGVLTKREKEVLALVGLGLSNPEIAERLFISRKTAAHHVSKSSRQARVDESRRGGRLRSEISRSAGAGLAGAAVATPSILSRSDRKRWGRRGTLG